MILLVVFMGLVACTNKEQQAASETNFFDLTAYVDDFKKENSIKKDVQLISQSAETIDTIQYPVYGMDSIARLIRQFDFNLKERSLPFNIKQEAAAGINCEEIVPQFESEIKNMTVCKRQGEIVSLSGTKSNRSILSIFYQHYHFEPSGRFELSSMFVDKMKNDTLVTVNQLIWD